MTRTTRAIVIRSFGDPDVLQVEDFPLPELRPSDVRIQMIAAAVNHSDLEVRTGAWRLRRAEPFPYVPGLEVVGDIVDVGATVSKELVGKRAITMMQGLGGVRAERAGGYQHDVTVGVGTIAIVPREVDPLAAASLGLAAVTAHQGLARLGPLADRKLVVTGASGGVGSAACALGVAVRARVIALVRTAAHTEYLQRLGVERVITSPGELTPCSVDAVLDSVVGSLFEPLVGALADGGRYCMVGAMGGDRATFSAWELMRGISLTGYSSETLDGAGLRAACADLFPRLLRGELVAPAYETLPLSSAAEAHRRIEARGVKGRILLVPDR